MKDYEGNSDINPQKQTKSSTFAYTFVQVIKKNLIDIKKKYDVDVNKMGIEIFKKLALQKKRRKNSEITYFKTIYPYMLLKFF